MNFSDSITAFILLTNCGVENSRLILILAASAPRDAQMKYDATIADYVSAVDYRAISTVLLQCENFPNANSHGAH